MNSKKGKKSYSGKYKLSRVLEAINEGSITKIARNHGLNVNLICKWKKQLEEGADIIYGEKRGGEEKKLRRKISQLEQMIGKKEIELNLVQNFLDSYQFENSK